MSKKFNVLKKLTQDELDGLEKITDPSLLEELNLYDIKLRKNGTLDQRSRKTAETEYNNLLKQKRQKELEANRKTKSKPIQQEEDSEEEDDSLDAQIARNMGKFKVLNVNDGPRDEYSQTFEDVINRQKAELKRFKQQLKDFESKRKPVKKVESDESEEEVKPKKKQPKKVESDEEEVEVKPKKRMVNVKAKKPLKKVESDEEEVDEEPEIEETKKKVVLKKKEPEEKKDVEEKKEIKSSLTVL